jgi:hypothetical protein
MDTIARDSLADLLKIANKIVVKEDYYYDKYSGETGSQIIALGFYNNEQSLFWTYYPEVSYTLRNSFMLFDRNLGRIYGPRMMNFLNQIVTTLKAFHFHHTKSMKVMNTIIKNEKQISIMLLK